MIRLVSTLLVSAALATAGSVGALAQSTPMTIATGVDPSFSCFYVAKEGGYFEKHGLDVTLNTGPSGSATVAYVIDNQIDVAYGAEQAGVLNHNIDENVVLTADASTLVRFYGIVGNERVDSLEDLKGKRVGIAPGTGSEVFWLELVRQKNLNEDDYEIVNVEAPEMVAAIERGDIDAFSAWEPWLTKTVKAVPETKIVQDSEGIFEGKSFVYMHKGWVENNPDAAERFMQALIDATELLNNDPDKAARLVSDFLQLDLELTELLLPKLAFHIKIDDSSINGQATGYAQLKKLGKLPEDHVLGWRNYIYEDLLLSVKPEAVNFSYPE